MAFLTNTGKIGTSVGRVNIKREPTAGMQEAAAEAAASLPAGSNLSSVQRESAAFRELRKQIVLANRPCCLLPHPVRRRRSSLVRH
jgi:hypothetical protein